MTPSTQLKNRTRQGAAAVEMAVTLPVFLLVLLGIMEFGRAIMVQQLLVNSARLGARKAIIRDSSNSEIVQQVSNACQATFNAIPTVTLTVNGVVGADLSTADRNDLCGVKVSIPFSNVSLLPTPTWLATKVLEGSCIMEHE